MGTCNLSYIFLSSHTREQHSAYYGFGETSVLVIDVPKPQVAFSHKD